MNDFITPPSLSTSFSESGKSAKKRFDNILYTKAKKTGVLAFVLILLLVGIVGTMVACDNTAEQVEFAKKYIMDSGYKIVSDGKLAGKYILTNEKLVIMPHSMYWGFLEFDEIDRCIDKEIFIYQFTVKNHPLDNAENNNKKQTLIWVMVCDNQAVGGYSLPDYLEPVTGGVYSIDGKTLEEVKGMDLSSWQDLWEEKYGSVDNPKDRPNLYYTMPHYSSMPVKALISSNSWGAQSSSYPSSTERQYDECLSIRPNSTDIPVLLSLKCEDEKISTPQILEANAYLMNNTQKEIPIKIIDNSITFMPPKDIGEYIYSVAIKFEKGTVSYDVKIVVENAKKVSIILSTNGDVISNIYDANIKKIYDEVIKLGASMIYFNNIQITEKTKIVCDDKTFNTIFIDDVKFARPFVIDVYGIDKNTLENEAVTKVIRELKEYKINVKVDD